MRKGVYPGSFNPPTLGHVAIVEAAIRQHELDRIDLVISEIALAKPIIEKPSLEERIQVLEESFIGVPQVHIVQTPLQLIADIAVGYDLVVMGADKWVQLHDITFYENETHMRESLSTLPALAVAPRGEVKIPKEIKLEVPEAIAHVSSSTARKTNFRWMTKAAQAYSKKSGVWIN